MIRHWSQWLLSAASPPSVVIRQAGHQNKTKWHLNWHLRDVFWCSASLSYFFFFPPPPLSYLLYLYHARLQGCYDLDSWKKIQRNRTDMEVSRVDGGSETMMQAAVARAKERQQVRKGQRMDGRRKCSKNYKQLVQCWGSWCGCESSPHYYCDGCLLL